MEKEKDFRFWSDFCHKALATKSLKCYYWGAKNLAEILQGEQAYKDEFRLLANVYFMMINDTLNPDTTEIRSLMCQSFKKSRMMKPEAIKIVSETINNYSVPDCIIKKEDIIDIYKKVLSGEFPLADKMISRLKSVIK